MLRGFWQGFVKAVFSGVIGSALLIAIVYVQEKEVNWALQIMWFLLFTLVMSIFYGFYFSAKPSRKPKKK